MEKATWKIGELARQSGITVRTLHHYQQIGLLLPSEYTESGHRLYTKADISKLQQILSLKQMGLSLKEIHAFIANPDYDPLLLVQTQIEIIKEQMRLKEKLLNELEQLKALLLSDQNTNIEQLFRILEVIRMNESNRLTTELVEKMKAYHNSLTEEQKTKLQKQLPLIKKEQLEALQKMIRK